MSKEFMNCCAHERGRLLNRIQATENVLELYRQLWKVYDQLEAAGANKATWKACKQFIEAMVSPTLKAELQNYKESLENVTRAQEMGCIQIETEARQGNG